jgi:RNA polymerase sigma factor (sigma-70 family)
MNPRYSHATDSEIWLDFRTGVDEAYTYIYKKYAPALYNYGRHLNKDKQLVKDCLHDLFVYLYQHRNTLGDTTSIKYYLFKSLKRRISLAIAPNVNFRQAEQLSENYDFEIIQSPELLLIAEQISSSQYEELRNAVNGLPTRQREVIYLLFYHNLSHQEIASIMSIEIRTVYNQVYKALEVLRKQLRQNRVFRLLLLLLPDISNELHI